MNVVPLALVVPKEFTDFLRADIETWVIVLD
jgi:hypothetical protein